jgi:sialic acid synthase
MPEGMRKLVRDLQRVPGALGDGVKRPLEIEEAPIRKMGKKLVAARELEEGHVLAAEDVAIKSPADRGLPPYELENVVGRRLTRRLAPDENVELGDLEPVERPVAAHAAPRP